MKLVGITFLILQKGGEVNINSLNTCLKKINFDLMSLGFVIIKKGEIVDINKRLKMLFISFDISMF